MFTMLGRVLCRLGLALAALFLIIDVTTRSVLVGPARRSSRQVRRNGRSAPEPQRKAGDRTRPTLQARVAVADHKDFGVGTILPGGEINCDARDQLRRIAARIDFS